MSKTKAFIIGAILTLAAFVVSIVLYKQLPQMMPTHWNINSQIDGYGDKSWAAFLMPGFMVFFLACLKLLPWLSPKKYDVEDFGKTFNYIIASLIVFSGYMHGVILWAALGNVDVGKALIIGCFLMIAILGNVLGKVRRNFWIGVRTPWTLADERVWNETHRFAAKIYVFTCTIGIIAALLNISNITCFIVMMIALLMPVPYSLVRYKQISRGNLEEKSKDWIIWAIAVLMLAVFVWGVTALSVPSVPTKAQVPNNLKVSSKLFIDNLNSGKSDLAYKTFDTAMRNAMPEEQLKDLWPSLTSEDGKFISIKKYSGERVQGFFAVYIACEFEKSVDTIKLVYDNAGKISGMWFVSKTPK